jgi:dienelactone hydrolase
VAQAQAIAVSPSTTLLAGDPASIRITGLKPGAEVTVQSWRQVREYTGELKPYGAQAHLVADAQGHIALATAVPLPGSSYTEADLRGLFWSQQPEPAPAGVALPPEGQVLLRVMLRVMPRLPGASQAVGHTGAHPAPLAEQTITLRRAWPQVQSRPASHFVGAVFAHLPNTPGAKRPALIILGGSEGGSMITRDAPVWASRGYAVLALPYYSPPGWGPTGPTAQELPGLPEAFADIPLERLEEARAWLQQQPEVDATRIGVLGTSKGAEFALAAAVRMPWIRSVVAYVPSDVIWEGWGPGIEPGKRSSFSWKGQPLPFVPYQGFAEEFANIQRGEPVLFRRPQDRGRAAHPARVAPARIAVEDIAAPVMVIGAHDDQVWDSGGMAENIERARRAAGRETVALVYREGGHALGGAAWSPTTQYNAAPFKMGGTPASAAAAQADSFARVLAFLQRTLGPVPAFDAAATNPATNLATPPQAAPRP